MPTAAPIPLIEMPATLRQIDGTRVNFSTLWTLATQGPQRNRLPTVIINGRRCAAITAVRRHLAARAARANAHRRQQERKAT